MTTAYIPAALRRLVYDRANGCCEYCLTPEAAGLVAHQIDHVIAQKHGGLTEADNLALSCTLCNKHKGSDIASPDPATSEIVPLYHPRCDRWIDHFQLQGALIIPLTPVARATVRLLQFNRAERVAERELLIAANAFHLPAQ
jgi:hypothetical protein